MRNILLVALGALLGYAAATTTPTAQASIAPGFSVLFMFSADASASDDAPATETFIGELASDSICDSIARALTHHARETPSDKVGSFGCKRELAPQ